MNIIKPSKVEKILVFGIILSPFVLYIHLFFPTKETLEIFSYSFKVRFQLDWQMVAWNIFVKFYLLILLSLWFITNKKWWRFAIIPILFYTLFQLVSIINDEFLFFDNGSNARWYAIGIGTVLIPLFLFIHKKVGYNPLSFSEKIENTATQKLTILIEFDKQNHIKLKDELESLKSMKDTIPIKDYLYKLMAIQTAIEASIKDE